MCMYITTNAKLLEIDGKMIAFKHFSYKYNKDGKICLIPYNFLKSDNSFLKDNDCRVYKSVKIQDGNIVIESELKKQRFVEYYVSKNLTDVGIRNSYYGREIYVKDMGLHSENLLIENSANCKELFIDYNKNTINILVLIDNAFVQFVGDEDIFSKQVIIPNPKELKKIIDILKRNKYKFNNDVNKYLEQYPEFYKSIKLYN